MFLCGYVFRPLAPSNVQADGRFFFYKGPTYDAYDRPREWHIATIK